MSYPLASSGMFKPHCMTIFMHDTAFSKKKIPSIIPFVYTEPKNPPIYPIQIYQNVTMELLRTLTDEQIGKIVRQSLNKVDEEKRKIEAGEYSAKAFLYQENLI